jgi:uncharacterized OB-fold protein
MRERPKPMMGPHDKAFWDYVQQGELRLQGCSACGEMRYPPAPVCARCLSPDYAWKKMSGLGKIVAWTTFHRQYLPQFPVPHTVASVMLDEGPMLIADIDIPSGGLRIDQPTDTVFEDVPSPDGNWRIYRWRAVTA